jgi:3-oxoacyl-[acyl-carrier protein] reductase
VNVASVDAIHGRARAAHYAATKGAVLGWTRSVAIEWAKNGIRVNAIAPAADTPMYQQFRSRIPEDEIEFYDKLLEVTIPLGGAPGDPVDIAPAVAFLISDMARFITGQTLPVDGGMCKVG